MHAMMGGGGLERKATLDAQVPRGSKVQKPFSNVSANSMMCCQKKVGTIMFVRTLVFRFMQHSLSLCHPCINYA
jgi:hypothetical protein